MLKNSKNIVLKNFSVKNTKNIVLKNTKKTVLKILVLKNSKNISLKNFSVKNTNVGDPELRGVRLDVLNGCRYCQKVSALIFIHLCVQVYKLTQ